MFYSFHCMPNTVHLLTHIQYCNLTHIDQQKVNNSPNKSCKLIESCKFYMVLHMPSNSHYRNKTSENMWIHKSDHSDCNPECNLDRIELMNLCRTGTVGCTANINTVLFMSCNNRLGMRSNNCC